MKAQHTHKTKRSASLLLLLHTQAVHTHRTAAEMPSVFSVLTPFNSMNYGRASPVPPMCWIKRGGFVRCNDTGFLNRGVHTIWGCAIFRVLPGKNSSLSPFSGLFQEFVPPPARFPASTPNDKLPRVFSGCYIFFHFGARPWTVMHDRDSGNRAPSSSVAIVW